MSTDRAVHLNEHEKAKSRSSLVDKFVTALFALCCLVIMIIGIVIVFDLVHAGLQLAHGLDPLDGSVLVNIGSWAEELILSHTGA